MQAYLPTKHGAVVAVCLTRELNPRAPHVIICGKGPQIRAAADLLAAQTYAIPVFLKRAVNRWEYQGLFRPTESFTSGPQLRQYIADSGRHMNDVSRVVLLEAM